MAEGVTTGKETLLASGCSREQLFGKWTKTCAKGPCSAQRLSLAGAVRQAKGSGYHEVVPKASSPRTVSETVFRSPGQESVGS